MAMKDAYSTQEAAALLGITRQSVERRAIREGWQSRPRSGRGGGKEWLLASMPEATRIQIAKAVAESSVPAPITPSDIAIPDWANAIGLARFRLVMEWRERCAKSKQTKSMASAMFELAYRSGQLLPNIHKQLGDVSIKTLYRWDAMLRDHNDDYQALCDRRGAWTSGGPKGLGQVGREAESTFLKAYLNDRKPSMRLAWLATCSVLEKHGLEIPSYSSVVRMFKRFDAENHDVVVLMREGAKALEDKVGKFMNRDDGLLKVGDVLVADGHKLNFLIINPETGKPTRYTLVGWQDWASRMFLGFELMPSENTQAIASSLYRSIIQLGKKPGCVLLDNGKAFKNKFFEQQTDLEELDGLYLRLGINVMHSQPYAGRTKIIERWWGDFDRQAECAIDSYIGHSIADKPAHLMRNEDWQQSRQTGWVPTLEDAKRLITDYAKWKAIQPHPKRPGTTPWEVFAAGRGEGFSEDERADLARGFLYRKKIRPARCRFAMMGLTFESDELYGINKELTAHYSFSDLSEVYVYDDGRLVTVARPVESVHPMAELYGTALDVATVKKMQKAATRLRAGTRKLAEEIGGEAGNVMMSLQHMQGVAERRKPLLLRPRQPEALPLPELSEEEAAQLAAIAERHQQAEAAQPAYTLPEFFASELDKYAYLFEISVINGTPLKQEDMEFMTRYETSEEYRTTTGRRFEQLRGLYAPKERTA
ncbi:DNA-binding domain-containing protein [uncultured Bilophila sp.]|uniref:DNA-binding domain-containing protein n=1 Tax=uncultured Bilophila sp. TaxID=529385 RepID=UPI002615C27F|nr:DNA-binding domain-containing protein [uncultured Bilophila sp.]